VMTRRQPSIPCDRLYLRKSGCHACKVSRFHILIEAQTVLSTSLKSGPPRFLHITRLLKALRMEHATTPYRPLMPISSPVDVRRANTSRSGSTSPALQACGLALLVYAHCTGLHVIARLTALPAGMYGILAPLRSSTLSVPSCHKRM